MATGLPENVNASRAAADHAAALAARQRQSCNGAGSAATSVERQRRSHGVTWRLPVSVARQRCSHRNASCTTTPTARQHRRAAAPVGRQYQSGRKNTSGSVFRPAPIVRRPSEGSSIKMCGVQSNTPSRPAFQKPVSCGFLSPFPWSTQRPFNKPHTFYLATPFRPLRPSFRSPFKPRNQALAR